MVHQEVFEVLTTCVNVNLSSLLSAKSPLSIFITNKDNPTDNCNPGYTEVAGTCVDIDECSSADLNNCRVGAPCNNFDGGYSCTCKDGYFALDFGCYEINECTGGLHVCDSMGGTCSNTDPHYDCICPDGSSITPWQNPTGTCVANDNCGPGTSYSCDCDPGQFELDIGCVDYNECSASDNVCDVFGGTCSNLEPYYECICSDGSKVNPVTDPTTFCPPGSL